MPRLRFILFAAGLLGLLHFYIGIRLLPVLPGPAWLSAIGWALLMLSVLLQPIALMSRGMRNSRLGDRLAWAGMLAMGLFSSLLVLTILRDLVIAAALLFTTLTLGLPLKPSFVADSAVAVIMLAVLLSVFGFFNARRLARVVQVEVPLAGLPPELQGLRIVQISDIHVGPTIKHGYLTRIVDRVNALQPDLIAVTGDLVDGRVSELASHTAPLSRLSARHGSYFVTGNHEYYSGAPEWIAELRRLGLRVLMNEHVVLSHRGAPLVLAGVTDYSAGAFFTDHRSDPQAAIAGAPADVTRILLAHQPRSGFAASEAGYHLQISGHTHGGQFWPWNYFVPLQQPFTAGLHKLQSLWIYVSRGTGYWGPPKRFGAPSEITCLTLVAAPRS